MPQVSIQVRVPFSDVDRSGRIHFTAMFRYMEIAEHELMRSLGFPYSALFNETVFPRVHTECNYLKAIRYDDEITVEARVEHVGRSSLTIAFTARHMPQTREKTQEEGEIAARGRITMVAVDPKTELARPLPDDLRAALIAA